MPVSTEEPKTYDGKELFDTSQENNGREGLPDYKTAVLQAIGEKKNYPSGARSRNQTGNVKLFLQISADGGINRAEVLETSGYSLLDQAALKTVYKAAPFSPLPEGMENLNITFVMEYQLK